MRKIEWSMYQKAPVPMAFAGQLAMRSDRWSSVSIALYLLAVSGWNLVIELGEAIAAYKGAQVYSESVRKVFREYLPEHGLGIYDGELPYLSPYKLAAARLTGLGKEVSRACGWEPAESGWERLIRLHEGDTQIAHTAAVLAFAREARLRGYRADILPDVSGKGVHAAPDVYVIDRNRRRSYVEVETSFHHEKPEKWQNLNSLQGYVAVASKTLGQRLRLVEEIKRLRLIGWATDLETLRANARTGDPYFLFVQRWDQNGNDIRLPRDGRGASSKDEG